MKAYRPALVGYGTAVAGVVGTAGVCALLMPQLSSDRMLLLPLLLPVILAALVGGLGPGLAATGLAAAAALAVAFAAEGAALPDGGDVTALGIFVAEGVLTSWLIGVARSPFERRAVEEALRRSEERYRAIVDSQAEMVCRFRLDGEILFANGGYARARGTTPEALVAGNFWDFIADEDRPAVADMLARLTPEARELRIENRFETADGVRWTLWTNRGLSFDESGRCVEAQSTGIDITDRKEAEEALRESNRRKSEFLAVLGHELRNPLAPLSAGIELLQQPSIGFESIVRVRAMMKRQLDHLTRLVEDLVDLARISRGDVILRKGPLDVRDVVDAAVELCMPAIIERHHRLVVETGRTALPVEGDFQRLTQVVGNVLGNAAKYTEPGGSIDVTASSEDGHVVVRVRDTGYGLPPDRVDTLFDMFTQIPEHRERTGGGGLGIGLALCRQLIACHGGTIEAKSGGLGLGSEFVVRLPQRWETRAEPSPAHRR